MRARDDVYGVAFDTYWERRFTYEGAGLPQPDDLYIDDKEALLLLLILGARKEMVWNEPEVFGETGSRYEQAHIAYLEELEARVAAALIDSGSDEPDN